MKKVLTLTLCMLFAVCAYAYDMYLTGDAELGGKSYSVVAQLNRNSNGTFSGRYAYNSTLRKVGNVRKAYLYITPTDSSGRNYVVKDASGKVVEYWYNVSEWAASRHYRIEANVKTKAGKYYTITLYAPYN